MRLRLLSTTTLVAVLLAGCGGGGTNKIQFTQLVSFGDSLSDVGTYRVGSIAAAGGGEFTINSSSNKIWVEDIASELNLSAPCAAQTGLDGSALLGFSVAVVNHKGCYGYAQGGSRVTDPVGSGNAAEGGNDALIGLLTVPVVTQIQNYLSANDGSFTGTELVTVLAGANDVLLHFDSVQAGDETSTVAKAAMVTAGTQLAGYITNDILGKGANYVLVANLPDISLTPSGLSGTASSRALYVSLVNSFNSALSDGLASASTSKVVIFDLFATSQAEAANPSAYGLTNVTNYACNLDPSANLIGNALICTTHNLNSGDILNYEYADTVHPTPYAHSLLAKGVLKKMSEAGWY